MNFSEALECCVPREKDQPIPWEQMEQLLAPAGFSALREVHQNPVFHGEDDVHTHTRMVCEALNGLPAFHALSSGQKSALFLAALLHDIGKERTTRRENDTWVSPHHARAGSQMARTFLWRDCGLCGTAEAIAFRETVCALVRHHMLPAHLMAQENPELQARGVAALGELAEGFSWRLLCLLAEADVRGRIAEDIPDCLAQVELARLLAEELACLDGLGCYADRHTRYAVLSGRNVQPDQALYDDTWGEVILLSGLPGTGKDTWIQRHRPDLPAVSLDDLRHQMDIRPSENQGKVIQAAQEQAREHLRKKEEFVWNATNLTRETRRKLVGLFERYGARVRIIYLETGLETREARNLGRAHQVPESAVARMLENTVPPTPEEAQTVEWICV